MPTFTYQAKQGPANVIEGTIEAQSQDEVVARLLRDGLVPVSILIKPEELEGATGRRVQVRVRAKEVRLFTRQLSSLLKAKVELVPAMTILAEQSPSRASRRLIADLERHMREGNSFSDALGRHPRVFSPFFLAAIRAGEAAGKLDDILLKLIEFGEQQEDLESRLKSALAYPLMLLIVGLACLVGFVWVIVPRMAGLFDQLGGALPWPTRLLISSGQFISGHWIALLVGFGGCGLVAQHLRRLPIVIAAAEGLAMRLPIACTILQAQQVARLSRTLQLLLHSGLPVFQALEVARPTLNSRRLEQRMQEAQEHVKRGESVASSLKAARCFPPLVTHLVAVGESSGTLVEVLDEVASYYERFLKETLRIATSLLEPAMILFMGLLVGFCVMAMVLPVFQMTQLVR